MIEVKSKNPAISSELGAAPCRCSCTWNEDFEADFMGTYYGGCGCGCPEPMKELSMEATFWPG